MSTRARLLFPSSCNASHRSRRGFRSAARIALALAAAALTSCANQDPATQLTARYPQAAQRILAGPGFTRAGRGFLPAEPAVDGGDPVKAAEASLARRGGLRLELPLDGAGAAAMTLPGGLAIEVRERGLTGSGVPVGGAVAYPRAGGTSYWMATGEGFEEWIEVEKAGDRPVAEWEVTGATLRQDGDAVLVGDGAGTARARVTAPRALSAGGGEARAWLRVEGQAIALFTDARGPALVDPVWMAVGGMATAREWHTATLLLSGNVLVAGGCGTSGDLASAELYDPATGTWSATGPLKTGRANHTATLLPSGKVLVAGGINGSYLASAELYDPAAGTWSDTGSLITARISHTATLLKSGKVLVVGGAQGGTPLLVTELYDPVSGTWSDAGSLPTGREFHTATLLPSGKVLVAGGHGQYADLFTAELYDPTVGTWSATGSLAAARNSHSATLLPSGMVLVAGGTNSISGHLTSVELYDPGTETWSATGSLATARYSHMAALLPSGKVVVAGGWNGSYLASAELYDPVSGTWSATGSLATARADHTGTLLPSGKVLVAGGYGTSGYLAGAELHDPVAGTWSSTGSLTTGRLHHTATLLLSGKVLVAAGYGASGYLASAELYDPAAASWSATGSLATGRSDHTATLLRSGKVLVAGGHGVSGELASAELYDPVSATWSATGSLATTREYHTATLLPSGKVLVAGGFGGGSNYLPSAELFDPAAGTWSATGSLATAREYHTATLLPSGKVLVAGGDKGGISGELASAELYDPPSGIWSATGSLATARYSHTATLLPSGRVLVAGGFGASGYLPSAESYDPVAGTWSATGSLATAREFHTATLLPSGKVLVAAGYGASGYLVSAELFEPSTGTWSATGSLGAARSGHTATLLPSGKVLVSGGNGASNFLTTAELFDEGRGAQPAWTPVLTTAPAGVVSGSTLTLGGQLFTGVSEASGGNTQTSATNYPLALLQAADGGVLAYAAGTAWSASSLTVTLPATLQNGPYWVRVIVSGVPSNARLIQIVPLVVISPSSVTLAPKASQTFTAAGGSGIGYVWSLATNASGATINSTTGAYKAGAKGSVTDVVRVTDSLGNVATVNVTVTAGVTISPASATLAPKASRAFAAAGGSGTGWAWSLATNASGGTIDATTGAYTAGATGDVTDVVRVVDSFGNTASVSVSITSGVSILPPAVALAPKASQTFTATGGSGTGYVWSLWTNASGATINVTTGVYTAGATGLVTDVVRVVDSLGNTASVNVTVTSGPWLVPSSATLAPKASQTFTLSGGSGSGYTWSFVTNASGATLSSTTGSSNNYTAGATGGVNDVLEVTDSLGNTASVSIAVTAGVAISPATATVNAGTARSFTASGGSGTGYVWSLATNASGGGIDPSTGAYTAGATGGVTDVVRVTDSLGNTATANVTVTAGVSIVPSTAVLAPKASQTFGALGGSGLGYAWSLPTNGSGGTINATSGAYQAGATGGVTDVVRVVDSLGNAATASITVTAGLSILPPTPVLAPKASQALMASGGSATGYVWSLVTNASGATLDPVTGAYKAGATGGVTDVVQVTDSLGNVATVAVSVTAGLSILPSSVTIPPKGTQVLTVQGGSRTGYVWSLAVNASGATLGATTGPSTSYTAGATGGVTDILQMTDSLGNTASVSISVAPAVSISPASASTPPKGSRTFTASGGNGISTANVYTWSLVTNASGGALGSATGASTSYMAGTIGGVTDVLQVTDSLGNTATVSIDVTAGVSISPAAAIAIRGTTQSFTASGGSSALYTWSFVTNASGGTLGATVGSSIAYTAGTTVGTDVVRVTDQLGNTATASVTVVLLAITPSTAAVAPRESQSFTAAGGTGYVWSFATNASGGTIDAATGAYTAGATGGVTDVVEVTDSLGNIASVSIAVTAGVAISPATATVAAGATQSFTASGGSGTGWVWSLATNASGGTIDPSTGGYTAGATGGVTDVVEVTDSLGNTSTANVIVTAAQQPDGGSGGGGCGCGSGGGSSLLLLVLGALALSRPRRREVAV